MVSVLQTIFIGIFYTLSGFLDLRLSLLQSDGKFLLLLLFSAFVEVLHDDTDEHVEDKEADDEKERDEVEDEPFVVITSWLQRNATRK